VKRHEKELARIVFEVARLEDEVVEAAAADVGELPELVGRIKGRLASLQLRSRGMSVEQAAAHLALTPPTVRKWVRRGVLRKLDGKPSLEVEIGSVLEVAAALDNVRASAPARLWLDNVATYLHDREFVSDDWVQAGVAAYRRGELVD